MKFIPELRRNEHFKSALEMNSIKQQLKTADFPEYAWVSD